MKPFIGSKVRLYAASGKVGKLSDLYPDTFFAVIEKQGSFITVKIPTEYQDPPGAGDTLKAPSACVTGIKGYTSVFAPLK